MNKWFRFILLLCLISICFLLVACNNTTRQNNNNENIPTVTNSGNNQNQDKVLSSEEAEEIIFSRAKEVITAIKDKNMVKVSEYIHPNKELRFSPYSHVDIESDLVFTSKKINDLLKDKTKYKWGHYEGSGEPIELTPEEYFNRFVYSRDFANAEQIGYNKIMRETGLKENQFEVYPNSIIVEYYFPGFDPRQEGFDWESLRLVFEKMNDTWYLVGIIHNQWTI